MRFTLPADLVHVGIILRRDGQVAFNATLNGYRSRVTTLTTLRTLLHYPLGALRVTALIRYQGIRLLLRGLPVVGRPDAPDPMTSEDTRSPLSPDPEPLPDPERPGVTTYELQPRQASSASVGPWTQLPAVPHAPIHAAVARRIFTRAAARLGVTVELPDGRLLVKPRDTGAEATATPVMRLHRPAQFFRRLGHDGLIGFGESYMAGEWDADDVASVLTPFARRMAGLVPGVLQRARRWYDARQPASEHNDLRGSKSNISRHYDLSNELFALFLDRTMTYSSAIWEDASAGATDSQRDGDALAAAQIRKIDRLLDLAAVKAGTRLLEIGTGWGELAVRAASRGAKVTTLTLSREQQAWAIERAELAGVGDLVDVQLRDYREVSGTYDAVVSVEMIEAVGLEYWPDYFATIDRVLAPGGRVALQSITIEHQRLLATKGTVHLDPQVRVPRWHHPVAARRARCCRAQHEAASELCDRVRPRLRTHTALVA